MGLKYGENAIDYDVGYDDIVIREVNEADGIAREYTEVIVKCADFDAAVTPGNHVAENVITPKLAGMKLVDVYSICATQGAGGGQATTNVMIHRLRATASQDIMDTGLTHGAEYSCHDGAVDETYEVTQLGDIHAIDVDTWRTGMLGFWVVFCYKPVTP